MTKQFCPKSIKVCKVMSQYFLLWSRLLERFKVLNLTITGKSICGEIGIRTLGWSMTDADESTQPWRPQFVEYQYTNLSSSSHSIKGNTYLPTHLPTYPPTYLLFLPHSMSHVLSDVERRVDRRPHNVIGLVISSVHSNEFFYQHN